MSKEEGVPDCGLVDRGWHGLTGLRTGRPAYNYTNLVQQTEKNLFLETVISKITSFRPLWMSDPASR